MLHTAVKIYLYALIFLSLFFIGGCTFLRLRRERLPRPKLLWRNVIHLIIAAIFLYPFYSGALGDWTILWATWFLLIGSIYAVEAAERPRSQAKAG